MFYLHFADEESKAQRNELPQVHIATEEKRELGFESRYPTLKPVNSSVPLPSSSTEHPMGQRHLVFVE